MWTYIYSKIHLDINDIFKSACYYQHRGKYCQRPIKFALIAKEKKGESVQAREMAVEMERRWQIKCKTHWEVNQNLVTKWLGQDREGKSGSDTWNFRCLRDTRQTRLTVDHKALPRRKTKVLVNTGQAQWRGSKMAERNYGEKKQEEEKRQSPEQNPNNDILISRMETVSRRWWRGWGIKSIHWSWQKGLEDLIKGKWLKSE